MISMAARARRYEKRFPEYPPVLYENGWLYGVWMIGNYYKRKKGFYGEYPPSYLDRVMSMFPDCRRILHAFSGVVDKRGDPRIREITVDIDPELKPDIVGDIEDIECIYKKIKKYLKSGKKNWKFDLILADPPYSKEDAQKYGHPYPNKRICLRSLARVTKKKGFLVWLDVMIPIYRKIDWILVGTIALITGTNRRIRLMSIFRKSA